MVVPAVVATGDIGKLAEHAEHGLFSGEKENVV